MSSGDGEREAIIKVFVSMSIFNLIPSLYYVIASGVLLHRLSEPETQCEYWNDESASFVNANTEWLPMARFCLATSIL